MAKKYRKSSCPEPLNTMIDIAGAVTMGLVSRSMVKNDIKKGQGRESVAAARMVFGAGALRQGSDGLISFGGLMGVESAVRSAERENQRHRDVVEEDPLIADLERRINAPKAARYVPSTAPIVPQWQTDRPNIQESVQDAEEHSVQIETFIFCRVSRLDNGSNEYYLAEHEHPIGSKVQIDDGAGIAEGIVLTVEKHSVDTAPVSPELAKWIL